MKVRNCKNGTYFTKQGMLSVIDKNGSIIPVTVLKIIENKVLKQDEKKALCVFSGHRKKFSKSLQGHLAKLGETDYKKGFVKEIELPSEMKEINLDFFKEGDFVDVSAYNKGKGFQGGMKRYGFKGGRASHGNSLAHRSIGSTGCRHLPSKTIKGRRMAGHMGNVLTTQQNLSVARLDTDLNCLLVKGTVPGPKKATVFVKKAIKKGGC